MESKNIKLPFSQKDWEKYAREFNLPRYEIWQMYVWTKDSKGDIIPDTSKDNIKRCRDIYISNKSDKNNIIRWLLINIFAGRWDKRIIEGIECNTLDKEEVFGSLYYSMIDYVLDYIFSRQNNAKEYMVSIRKFFRWGLNDDFFVKNILESYMISDYEELWAGLQVLSIVCGAEYFLSRFNPDFLKRDFSFGASAAMMAEGLYSFYVLAEYFYKQQHWADAFYFYKHILMANEREEIYKYSVFLEESEFPDIFKDILDLPVSIEDIREKASVCLSEAVQLKDDEFKKIEQMLDDLFWRSYAYLDNIRSGGEEGLYFDLFKNFAEGNIAECDDLLSRILDSIRERQNEYFGVYDGYMHEMMLDSLRRRQKEIEAILPLIKKRKESNLKNYLYITEIEEKIRKLIKASLEEKYGPRKSWISGVPLEIRRKAVVRHEDDPQSNRWDCLDFSDYADIIESKDNWRNIFKDIFEKVSPKDSKYPLKLLRKLPDIRNIIAHNRRNLKKSEIGLLTEAKEVFGPIYRKWEEIRGEKCLKRI